MLDHRMMAGNATVHGVESFAAAMLYLGFGYAALARLAILLRALARRAAGLVAPHPDAGNGLSVTLLVPARQEHLVIGRALRSMLACQYPAVTVMAVVDGSDPRTLEAAEAIGDGSGRLRVIRDNSDPPGKGRALTAALSFVSTDVVGIFDADSVVHPQLLDWVTPLLSGDADVAQVPVRPSWDPLSSWHGPRTLLDYAAWSRAMAGVSTGPVRLSGTGVFFRTALLRSVGGWRPSLTEDFDLAIRLTAVGARIAVVDCPQVATSEEVPHSARSLLHQRIRWHQGFLEILGSGIWRGLPCARLRMVAMGPILVPVARALAVSGAVLLLIACLAGRSAAGLAVLVPPLILAVVVLAIDCVVFARLAPAYGLTRYRRYLPWLVLGAIPFYGVSGASSVIAAGRELLGRRTWRTTVHGRQGQA